MRLVLVAGMNPRVCKQGPRVRLSKGIWTIIVEHLVDSDLVLHRDGSEATAVIHNGMKFQSNGSCFDLSVGKVGTEQFVNVFAELNNGPVATATS